MSGFFGIFNRNGKPIDKKIAEDMLKSMLSWGPDEYDLWIDGSVALGHGMLWNTPESKYEHLPLQKETYILTMDARIDNRDELLKELDLPDRPLEEIGDSEFILAAYRKWGEECTTYLLGDFAFAIWDKTKKQFFCSRDFIGIKPFYYYLDDKTFVFSNELKVLLEYGEIDNIINDNAVAHYLKNNFIMEQDATFFKNIHKLLPATNISISSNKEKKHTFWQPEECPKIRYKSIEEYIQRAQELLDKAVDTRIRSIYSIASHLSGGLDSSSIAVLASRKLDQSNYVLTGFNWIPILDSDSDINYYEWGNSRKIALLENIEHHAIDLSEEDIFNIYKTLDITQGDILHFWYESKIQKYASKKGIRVILSGTGGDEFISHKSLVRNVRVSWVERFRKVHRSLVDDSSGLKELMLGYIKKFYSSVIPRIIPDWLFCIYGGRYCSSNRLFEYLQPYILKLIKKQKTDPVFLKSHTIRDSMLNDLKSGSMQIRHESWDTSAKLHKLEYRYPLLDKRIVEFALGIPEELFYQKGIKRYLFKRVVEELLPEEITWSDTKSEPKRVEKYMERTQKAQSIWRKLYVSEKKSSKYIKLDALFKAIDECSSNSKISGKNDRIVKINNAILILQSLEKGCSNEKSQ